MEIKKLKTIWDFSTMFASDVDLDSQIEKSRNICEQKTKEFADKWSNRFDYLEDTSILKEALDEYEIYNRLYGPNSTVHYYLHLKSAQDQIDTTLKAKLNQCTEIATKLANEIQFFEMRISKISKEKQNEFLNSLLLKDYKHFLEKLFISAQYTLSEEVEKVISLKYSSSYSKWEEMTETFISKEERETLNEDGTISKKSFSEFFGQLSSQDKKVRDEAALAINNILEKWVDVGENEINAIFSSKKVDDELRGYKRADEARHVKDDIDTVIVDALTDAVTKRFDIPARFYSLKAKLIGVDKLEYHERNIPYGEINDTYTYEEALNLVYKVYNNLDPQFGNFVKLFSENGQVDVYPKKGKRDGAFCSYMLKSHPTYILLNFNGKLNDVLTIAHEFGHGSNDELMKEKQNSLNFHTPTSTAEVASTFMEDFVLEEIMKTADDEKKLSIMLQKLNNDISSIFRQVACYNFESELHEAIRKKGYVPKEEIGEIFTKNMKAYMGDSVKQNPGSQNWWLYWGHLRLFFYVYSYASGLLISKSMQNFVKQDPTFILKVKEFLSAGSSDSPKTIVAKMGIDISDIKFWNKGINQIENLLIETEALANKLHKI